jgi:hypothetical protein
MWSNDRVADKLQWQMRPGRNRDKISNPQETVIGRAGHFATGGVRPRLLRSPAKIIIVSTAAMHTRLPLRVNRNPLVFGEAALAAHDKALGRDHPWTKDSARVTGAALEALGRAAEAAALRARFGIEMDGQRPT